MGLRSMYKVFRETRNAAREQATLAVVGPHERAQPVAAPVEQRHRRCAVSKFDAFASGADQNVARGEALLPARAQHPGGAV